MNPPATPLTSTAVLEQLLGMVAKSLGKQPGDINPAAPVRDQGVDSLGMAELAFEIEDLYGVAIANEQSLKQGLNTLNDIAVYIAEQAGQSAAP